MVPATILEIQEIPLTHNGKTDRKALLAIDMTGAVQAQYTPPRTPLEALLARIWCDLLGIERAGIHDNFFELGGHSLMAMRLSTRFQKEFNVTIGLKDIFRNPDLEGQALLIMSKQWIEISKKKIANSVNTFEI
jgi:acyl carrier protein